MRRTLLLCFVHGFKGGADTFGARSQFSHDLRRAVAEALPRVDVRVAVYPTYETRGDLAACVQRLLDWLLNQVIDLEVAARTPSPTVDPSVRCVLIGHSMGGIVAADALLALAGDRRVGAEGADAESAEGGEGGEDGEGAEAGEGGEGGRVELNTLMFPYVQGVLGFDTPYLGIAPGVVAHGAEGQYAAASAALAQISGLTDALWGKRDAKEKEGTDAPAKRAKALPAAASAAAETTTAGSSWGWGKIALAGGAAAAAAATAAAAAYARREQLTEGWTWAASHLEFVGCLARGEVLRARMARVAAVQQQLGVGFGNLYTRLGKAASARAQAQARGAAASPGGRPLAMLLPGERTFCNLPKTSGSRAAPLPYRDWRPAVNDAATDETGAHMGMFDPPHNPNYAALLADARGLIVAWTAPTAWYAASSGVAPAP